LEFLALKILFQIDLKYKIIQQFSLKLLCLELKTFESPLAVAQRSINKTETKIDLKFALDYIY
jgi:hypothetical protein